MLEKLWSFSYRFRLLVSTFVSVFQEYLDFGVCAYELKHVKAMVGFCFEITTIDSGNWLRDALSPGNLH